MDRLLGGSFEEWICIMLDSGILPMPSGLEQYVGDCEGLVAAMQRLAGATGA